MWKLESPSLWQVLLPKAYELLWVAAGAGAQLSKFYQNWKKRENAKKILIIGENQADIGWVPVKDEPIYANDNCF